MTPKLRNYTLRKQRAAPRGTRERLWQAMRIMREFTASDLAAACELRNARIAHAYISALRRAGYVRTRQPQRGLHQPAIHTLIRNSGPKCPAIVHRSTVVWDPNTDMEYPFA